MENFFDNAFKGKNVLITGETGFKGSWLAIWLLSLGANVSGYSLEPKTAEDNYLVSGLGKQLNHFTADIRDIYNLQQAFNQTSPEIVFHLAAQPLVLQSYNDPADTYSTNVMGTVNLLEVVRKTASVKVVIIVTSDKCYENKEWLYGYREIDPLGGKDPYSASKAAAEIITSSYIKSFFSETGTASLASVRAGNVIGGGDFSENRIFPDCIRALKENLPVIIRNPQAYRPWQHVLEPLGGYLTLASFLYKFGKKYTGAWNFGPSTKNIIPVVELVKKTIACWGKGNYSIEESSANLLEANFLQLDITKAVNQLNWQPVLKFSDCISYSVEEYKIDKFTSDQVFEQRLQHINQYCRLRQVWDQENV